MEGTLLGLAIGCLMKCRSPCHDSDHEGHGVDDYVNKTKYFP